MLSIPEGEITLRDDRIKSQWKVLIPAFLISRYPHTQDLYDESEYGSYRIFRGGGWNDEARGCLSTNRRRSHPTSFRIDDLGFRLARNY